MVFLLFFCCLWGSDVSLLLLLLFGLVVGVIGFVAVSGQHNGLLPIATPFMPPHQVAAIPTPTLKWFQDYSGTPAPNVTDPLHRLGPILRTTLLPFQRDGIAFGLQCAGRVLLGDEMGLGKSVQAIGIACCLQAWPLLVVCPACMRLVWAEEWEKWLPELLPRDLRVIFDSNDKLPQSDLPKVTVVSYRMATILASDLLPREWRMVIADESHTLRTTVGHSEAQQTQVFEACKGLPMAVES